jgi:5,10-methylenetetrahydromethanopterin reductase
MQVELGIGLQSDKAPADYARLTRLAETYGFDVLSVFGDLMYQPPIVPLIIAAQNSSTIRLGPACLNPYTLHPVEIAGQIAALDLASRGRAYLGLARGAWLGAAGIDQLHTVARLREAAEVVRRLLAGDVSGFSGKYFKLDPGTRLNYVPERPRVPLMIGTWSPKTAALAAEMADEVKIGGCANPRMVVRMREFLAPALRRARRTSDVALVAGAVTVVSEDGAAARQRARSEVAKYFDVVAEFDPTIAIPDGLGAGVRQRLRAGDHAGAGALIPDQVLDAFAIAGTPEQVAEHVRRLFEAGAQRVEFGSPHGLTEDEGINLLGSRVLPRLRSGG